MLHAICYVLYIVYYIYCVLYTIYCRIRSLKGDGMPPPLFKDVGMPHPFY